MGRFQSGQMDQTVNLTSLTSVVRIYLFPPRKRRYLYRASPFVLREKVVERTTVFAAVRASLAALIFGIRPLLFRARRRFAEGLPPAGFRQHVPLPTKKGLSEHCCFKKRYSDSLYFTKRRDAMKSVLFSYILHYPFLFAFRWGYRRISQRRCFYCFRKCFCII